MQSLSFRNKWKRYKKIMMSKYQPVNCVFNNSNKLIPNIIFKSVSRKKNTNKSMLYWNSMNRLDKIKMKENRKLKNVWDSANLLKFISRYYIKMENIHFRKQIIKFQSGSWVKWLINLYKTWMLMLKSGLFCIKICR